MYGFEIVPLKYDQDGEVIEDTENYLIMLNNSYFAPFLGYLSDYIDAHLQTYIRSGVAGVNGFILAFTEEMNQNQCSGNQCLINILYMICGWDKAENLFIPDWADHDQVNEHISGMCKGLEQFLLEHINKLLSEDEQVQLNQMVHITGSIFIPLM